MRKRNLTKAAILLLTLAFLAGCGNKAKSEWQKSKSESPDTQEDAESDASDEPDEETAAGEEEIPPEQMDLIKYNYYVGLNNQLIEILDSIDYYYQVVEDAVLAFPISSMASIKG